MVLNEATKVLSLQLGLTIDTLIRDMMVSTASTIACSRGLNGNTPTEITDADIQTAVIALRQGNARLMTNPLPGENKFGKQCAEVKLFLIDSEALQGNEGQAQAA